MTGRVAGKVALISGGASGFGRQSAVRLREAGAHVVVTDIDAEGGAGTLDLIGGNGLFMTLDVTSEENWSDVVDRTVATYGKLDVLVNSAGVAVENDNIEELDDAGWKFVIDANLTGTFLGCTTVYPAMVKAGGGSIVNLSSVLGLVGSGGALAYCASKGGVRVLTKAAAVYGGESGHNIRCNAICPGYMKTPMVEAFLLRDEDPEGLRAELERKHPMGHMGDADDIAHLVVYLASDESKFVTGSEIAVDGGYTAL
jgi:NAD(P)-dependent dehydrogenase (short-subunit alcohol dehydrogenase family)